MESSAETLDLDTAWALTQEKYFMGFETRDTNASVEELAFSYNLQSKKYEALKLKSYSDIFFDEFDFGKVPEYSEVEFTKQKAFIFSLWDKLRIIPDWDSKEDEFEGLEMMSESDFESKMRG